MVVVVPGRRLLGGLLKRLPARDPIVSVVSFFHCAVVDPGLPCLSRSSEEEDNWDEAAAEWEVQAGAAGGPGGGWD